MINVGLILDEMKDYKGAIDQFSKVIEIKPDYLRALNLRAISKLNSRDFLGSINDNSKLIKINPNNPDPYANRGKAKEFLEDLEGACEDWTSAASLGHRGAKRWILLQCNE